MDPPPPTLLVTTLKLANVTQAELGRRSGLSRATVSRAIRGRGASGRTWALLAIALSATLELTVIPNRVRTLATTRVKNVAWASEEIAVVLGV